jgi:hypothetical protein
MTTDEQLVRGLLAYPDSHLEELDPLALGHRARRRRRQQWAVGLATPVLVGLAAVGVLVASGTSQSQPPPAHVPTVEPSPVVTTTPPTTEPPPPPPPIVVPTATSAFVAQEAVAQQTCATALDVRLPGGQNRWITKVRTEPGPQFVVSVWTDVDPTQAAPGLPNWVCTVAADLKTTSVTPDLGTPGPVGKDGRAGGRSAPTQVVQFVNDRDAVQDAQFGSPTLAVGVSSEGRLAVADGALVFPRIPLTTACLESATIDVTVRQASGAIEGIGVYAAYSQISLAQGHLPDERTLASRLLASRPRGVSAPNPPLGPLRLDVTDLYKAWTEGFFDQNGAAVSGTAPFAVVVRPPTYAGTWSVELGGAGGADQPTLVWRGKAGCR